MELECTGGRTCPPESLIRLLFAHLRGQAVKPIARLRTRRTGMPHQYSGVEGPLADMVVDSVVALDGRRVIRHLYDSKMRLAGGDDKALLRMGKTPA